MTTSAAVWVSYLVATTSSLRLSVKQPWGILAPLVALRSRKALYGLLLLAVAFSVLGLVVKVAPGFEQDTYRLIGLLLPIWIGLAVGVRRLLPRK